MELWRGSWVASLVCLALFAWSFLTQPVDFANFVAANWRSLIVVVLVFFLSSIIGYAYRVAERYSDSVTQLLDAESVPDFAAAHVRLLRSNRAFLVSVPFMVLGGIAAFYATDDVEHRAYLFVLALSALYFGGFGLWGTAMVSRGIIEVAEQSRKDDQLNVFHPDKHGGLGFTVGYANTATLLMFTGIVAFPFGVFLANTGFEQESPTGLLAAWSAVIAIVMWAASTIYVGLRGRYAVARVLRELQDEVLRSVAKRKLNFVRTGGPTDQFDLLLAEERAALALRTNAVLGGGGWRDILSLIPTAFAIGQIDAVSDMFLIVFR